MRSVRRHLSFETVGSTNQRALEAALSGDPGPLWITAEEQVEGRGRRGRQWQSPRGNLYASFLVVEPSPVEHLANLPLVAAVGIADGLAALPGLDPASVRIKWPNDVLLGGAKCCGILIESERLPSGVNAVVIGFGLNVDAQPSDTPYKVATLRGAGVALPLDDIFPSVAEGLEAALRRWDRGREFPAMREEWIARSMGIGADCTVNLADRSVRGRFRELDRWGRLVLETEGGALEAFSAGDLFFGPTTNSRPR